MSSLFDKGHLLPARSVDSGNTSTTTYGSAANAQNYLAVFTSTIADGIPLVAILLSIYFVGNVVLPISSDQLARTGKTSSRSGIHVVRLDLCCIYHNPTPTLSPDSGVMAKSRNPGTEKDEGSSEHQPTEK
ncbi:unnamed protein product [Dibothriocephalus latus]|uniref:Uncharacterized protein n=1 Tax=Dibothriocephalus latus TaxID=60516 RepID=A0A3P6UJE6_DIBLA|nr:unnamed protein product [Dibothriocephalus latus]